VFWDGFSSLPDETVIPLWLVRHCLVCGRRVYKGEGEDHFWVGDAIVLCITATVSMGDTVGKDKGKVHPRTGHEGPGGSGGIALLFL